MAGFEEAIFQVGRLDRLARQDTPVHRLDPRAKILAVLVYLLCVVSFGKYEVSGLIPYAIFPLTLAATGRVPLDFIVKRLLIVSPFAFLIGIFNPLLDRGTILSLGPVEISGGWVSFVSILLRFTLTVGAALVLIAVTSFDGLCLGLQRMGVPRVFTVQLLFLYRYIWVLADEAGRLLRARSLRSFGKLGLEMRVAASLLGHLLLRTLDRARRVHMAMSSRGFTGELHTLRQFRGGAGELLFLSGWCTVFFVFRMWNIPRLLGDLALRLTG